ncbi:2-phosphosulfolactate phosphatase [Paenibacillus cisolokensis]|uniref:2-phosphosulfolactate phosphatase n=1 Tax=Paenibacillus cisolokensis TaxID=1658519 RepID=UPI003D26EC6B
MPDGEGGYERNMRVDVIATLEDAEAGRFAGRTAIVIDALRATSTIVTALANGADEVVPALTADEAAALRRPGDILGGERDGRAVPGFDCGNSPSDYAPEIVSGRRIVLTTTNGTRAIRLAANADGLLAGSFLNALACARSALAGGRDIVILCAGSRGQFALEDGLCAGAIADRMRQLTSGKLELDDFGSAMLALYRERSHTLTDALRRSPGGRKLARLGMEADVEACARVDICRTVPWRTENGALAGGRG